MNGRLLLAGRRPWHEWPTGDLLDMCDALREDERRFVVSLKAGVRIPDLPQFDTTRVAVATSAGYGYITVELAAVVEDDGTWGTDDESWQPPLESEGEDDA